MATNRWRGKAAKVAQVNTITPANVGIGNTFSVTINEKTITVTATAGTVANVTGLLLTALQASNDGEFQEITWADITTAITGTASIPGKPFTQTSSATGGTATNTTATTTANVSPNDVNNATNWSDGIPNAADDVVFDEGDVDALWNLDALSAITLTSFTRRRGYTGTIGLPERNTDGTEYYEYRATEFAISATTMTIEQRSDDEADQIKVNVGSAQTALHIRGEGAAGQGAETMRWRGTHVSNVVNVQNGSLSVAPLADTSAAIATLRLEGSTVSLGPAVSTLTTINSESSVLDTWSNLVTLNQKGDGGDTTFRGTVTITTANIDDGSLNSLSSGTITTLLLGTDAAFNKLDLQAQTITNVVNMYPGASILDPFGVLTLSNGFTVVRGKLGELGGVDFGPNRTFTVA